MNKSANLDLKVLDMDARELIKAYQDGILKPGEAVEIYIEHQKRFNPKLNLVVEKRHEAAREDARRYDELLDKGKIEGKLFGVPISMKEAFDVAGMHTTGGLNRYKDRVVQTDAEVVKRLRDEGAIILNKSNTPSLCFCQETDNYLFGRSNNPWKPDYTTGGSSGGEAGLIAVGGAAAGFGSDIGGSIRIPAHFNGVVGFKPGALQFPLEGHLPDFTLDNQKRMVGFGPIVKSVHNAALLYSIINPSFKLPDSWELPAGLKVVSFGSFHKTHCTPETIDILEKAKKNLQNAGIKVENQTPPFMKDVALKWQLIMSEGGAEDIVKHAYKGTGRSPMGDLIRAKLGLKALNHPYLSWGIIGANLFAPNEKQMVEIREFIRDGTEMIEQLVGSKGVFLIPTYPSPAKKHGKIYSEIFSIKKSFRWVLPYIAFANVFGLPALVVPCGRSREGLPIGLQVVSTVGNEHLVFRVGAFLEKCFDGYRRNTSYDLVE